MRNVLRWLPLLLLITACETRPAMFETAMMPGVDLRATDSLVTVGHTMGHPGYGFQSPAPTGFSTDTAKQREWDEKSDKAKARWRWARLNVNTGDHFEVYAYGSDTVGRESWLRRFAATQKRYTVAQGWAIDQDTVEWHEGAHEYRQRAHKGSTESMMRCVSSADARPRPVVVCYVAYGPTATTTLALPVRLLELTKYLGPMNGPTQQGTAGAAGDAVQALSTTPLPQNLPPLTFADGMATSTFAGFSTSVGPTVVLDPALTKRLNQGFPGIVLAWGLRDTVTSDTITITAMLRGDYGIGEAAWKRHAARELMQGMLPYPGAKAVSANTDWRADTATFAFTFRLPSGTYKSTMCKGSAVGRVRPVAICLHTNGKNQDAFAELFKTFRLTPAVGMENSR